MAAPPGSGSAPGYSGVLFVPRWIQLVSLPVILLFGWIFAEAVRHAIFIFLISGLIAMLLNPLVATLVSLRVPRGLAVLVIYVSLASGIFGAIILGLGRALGETMAVTMLIGNRHEIAASLFAPGYTMAAVIANEFSEAATDMHFSALAYVALVLFILTVVVNAAARLLIWRVARGAAIGSKAL